MTANRLLSLYTWAFLAFMFAPLLLMIATSFNNASPPTITATTPSHSKRPKSPVN